MNYGTRRTAHGLRAALFAGSSLLAWTAIAAPAAHAADAAPEEIIVTAGKREEKLREVAGGVSAATGQFLENIQAHSLADYAAFIPGFVVQSSGRQANNVITLRGISALSVGSATGTYVDEVPFGSANNYASGGSTAIDLDPSDIERVEVLKGPQGTLYGASSLGGLVKYVTKAPDLTRFSGFASAEGNSVSKGGTGYELRGGINAPIVEGKVGIRLSGYYREDGGFIDNAYDGKKDIDSATTKGARASILFTPVDRLQIRLTAAYQRVEGDGISAVDTDRNLNLTYGDLKVYRRAPETNDVKNKIYSATASYDFDWASLTSATSWSQVKNAPRTDYSALYPVTYAAFVPAGSTSQTQGGTSTNKTTQEVRLASPSNGKFEWIIGGFYQNEKSGTDQYFKIFKPDGSLADGLYGTIYQNNYATSLKEYAAFGDVTYYLTPEFDLTAGYRYSKNDQVITRNRKGLIGNPASPLVFRSRTQDSSENVSTYLFTARWRITPDAMVYARAASGYRPGGPRDVAPGTVAPAGFVFSFNPDTVWSYEAGLRTTWLDRKLTTDFSVYQINWKDIQALTPDSGFMVFNNAGNAKVKGAEFSGRLNPVTGLTLNLTASVTDTKLTSLNLNAGPALGAAVGDPLNNIPKWIVGVSADYDFPLWQNWSGFIGGSYRYRSDVWTAFSLSTTRQNLPSYDEIDLRAGATINNFTIQAYIKNLGDTRGYTTATAPVTGGAPYAVAVTRPRTIGVFTKVIF